MVEFFLQLRLRPVVEVLSLTTAAVLTLSAVVERCVWHRPVHTAMQLSKQVSYLLCTGPGFDPRVTTILVATLAFFYFFYLQRRRSRGFVLIGCKHKHINFTLTTIFD